MNEGNLHKWFKGSKSKDGKSGWVNVVTGGTCASDEPGEGTPKCVSSSIDQMVDASKEFVNIEAAKTRHKECKKLIDSFKDLERNMKQSNLF